ncbi:TonB system transport protein ExbD [Helicobacter cholecystus]|uniref:Biopolymer transport protein ExbD n=1 Tax=Helicobacter cholecystus TaxID=45498 RepID=A0A3D8IWH7_9HELI|nr:TonB system transport protein ExbD [Helicobacter cholecystus]RDU69618.1 TonB system transport protein ExbD [Helicobacter cholecystus]VEJ24177.1 ExbD/TolR family transport protein [Helicobacter cholecystus]
MKLKRGEGLNIVPFIDIMLVLLAIVLSLSTFIAQGHIPIQVPNSKHSQEPKKQKKLTISTDRLNQLYLDNKPVNYEELKNVIAQTSSKTLIEFQSDKEAKFETFVQILNLLKEKNHENFVITTQKN